MPASRDDLLRMAIPAASAVVLTVIYFAIFDRWTRIHDPINSIVTMVLGFAGFAIGVGLDTMRRNRGKTPAPDTKSTP